MKIKIILVSLALLVSTTSYGGASPSAIIEDINTSGTTLSFMDYVSEGQIIKLGSNGSLVLGYLNSCRRETITGGTVTIGRLQSNVHEGQLLREDVECDGGNAKLTGQVAATSGALAFRGSTKKTIGLRNPELTIYGTAPVILLQQANAEVTIERLDQRSKLYSYQLKGKSLDLVDKGLSLSLGGLYKITVKGGESKTFKVDKYAEEGKISIVSRLINL